MADVEQIKKALDIVQVISETVDLDTRSRTPKAVCPFHSERTPSFVVFPESQLWKCFGACATGGDVISFLMKRDNVEFRDALKDAAQRAGIELDTPNGPKPRSVEPALDANEMAVGYFWTQLNSAVGDGARAYLEGRGISMDIARRRDFGLAPSGMETLTGHLKSIGVSGAAAVAAGLVVQSRDGGWRDMFTGRLTIAIRDKKGKAVGFGARSLDGSDPKYLNTGRTEVFDKSAILYGLNWAEKAIRATRTAVVVEGYMDVLTAHEAGFENVVASMGTAITADQVAELRGLADIVVLALDSDAAGQEATLNSLETVWGAMGTTGGSGSSGRGIEIRVVSLEGGKDPDEVIRTSPNEWVTAVDNAAPLLEWLLESYSNRLDLQTDDGKAEITRTLFPLITAVSNPYEQDRYLTMLSEKLGVTIEQLRSSAGRLRRTRRARVNAPRRDENEIEAEALQIETTGWSVETHLLQLVLAYPDLMEYATELPDEMLLDATNRALFTALRRSDTIEGLRAAISPDLLERLDQLTARPLPPADQKTRVADVSECVKRLHERRLRSLKAEESQVRGEIGEDGTPDDTHEMVNQTALDTNERLRQLFARSR